MCVAASAIMPMSIASMNENSNLLFCEYNVRLPRERLVIHTVAVSHREQFASHQKLDASVLALDMGYYFASPTGRNRISHHTDKSNGKSEISLRRLP